MSKDFEQFKELKKILVTEIYNSIRKGHLDLISGLNLAFDKGAKVIIKQSADILKGGTKL